MTQLETQTQLAKRPGVAGQGGGKLEGQASGYRLVTEASLETGKG